MPFLEAVEKNKSYIEIAKTKGFFHGNEDISLCDDYIIVHWIAGLNKEHLSIERFVNEILPVFKSWYENGVKTNYVGEIYDFLMLAEMNGIEINDKSYDCLVSVAWGLKLSNINGVTLDSINVRNEALKIIKRLKHFQELGLPFCQALSNQYNVLCALEDSEENISFDTLVFLHTLGSVSDEDAIVLYDQKKSLSLEFGYYTNNGKEFLALKNWMCGYNYSYVSKLLGAEQKCNNIIYKSEEYDKMRSCLKAQLGEKLVVEYILMDDEGNTVRKKDVGLLKKVRAGFSIRDFGTITLGRVWAGMEESTLDILDDGEKGIITKVFRDGKLIYECKTFKERVKACRLKNKVVTLKKENLFKAYKERFETLEGLAYLQTSAKQFIQLVDPAYLPVNNLFAYCFEVVYSTYSGAENLLGYVLYAYNYILSGQVESLKGANYDYPLYHFLSEEVVEIVKMVCYYVVTEDLVQEVPEEPGTPITLMPMNYAHLTDENRKMALKNQILNGGLILPDEMKMDENDQSVKRGG